MEKKILYPYLDALLFLFLSKALAETPKRSLEILSTTLKEVVRAVCAVQHLQENNLKQKLTILTDAKFIIVKMLS